MLDELHELVADLQALLAWEELQGLTLLPLQPELTPSELALLAGAASAAPRAAAPRAAAPRAAAPDAAPPRQPAPAKPTRPTPAATPAAPPAATPTTTPAATLAAGSPRPALSGTWARLARTGALVSGAAGADGTEPLATALADALAAHSGGADPGAGLAAIREVMGDCRRCGLCDSRQNIVFGVGNPRARLVVLGEGPGEQEDIQSEPFVGPAGQMLDRMIENVLGLARSDVYIVNMVKCRPPRNRNPQPDELDACRPFLDAQLSALQPDLILVLGSVASRILFGPGITRTRGQWHDLRWPGGSCRAMATFHPAYLLRNPEFRRPSYEDLKLLRGALDALPRRD